MRRKQIALTTERLPLDSQLQSRVINLKTEKEHMLQIYRNFQNIPRVIISQFERQIIAVRIALLIQICCSKVTSKTRAVPGQIQSQNWQ
jgi:hypothetical protein